jgi:hypothetical protein
MKVIINDEYLIEIAGEIISAKKVSAHGYGRDKHYEIIDEPAQIALSQGQKILSPDSSEDAISLLEMERKKTERLEAEKVKEYQESQRQKFIVDNYEAIRRSPVTLDQVKANLQKKTYFYSLKWEDVETQILKETGHSKDVF